MKTYKINCGRTTIPLRIFDSGSAVLSGPTVVVTAGLDGDEYVGIRSAQSLVKVFTKTKPLQGRVVIIPLVNVPGFNEKISWNPHDLKYPKHVYPGNQKGTETERLIAWIVSHYIDDADYWIDLHGGASHESLTPFVWGYRTKNTIVNSKTQCLLRATDAPIIVYQKNFIWEKVELLAKKGCSYCIVECGDKGKSREGDVKQTISWVMKMFDNLGVGHGKHEPGLHNPEYYDEVHEYVSSKDGWTWKSHVSVRGVVRKGQIIGEIRDPNDSRIVQILARQEGRILWHRLEGTYFKDDILIALAAS